MTKNHKAIRAICEENSRISRLVIDEFLIGFGADYQHLGRNINKQFDAFKHITKKFDKEWIGLLMGQCISHRIFRNDGLIGEILNHPVIRQLSREERDFLESQAGTPWRFSFSVIMDAPAEDFFMMEDVFSGEQFLLFSPGITGLIQKERPILWLNLVGFNGMCWQSYGPIGAYKGFEPDDIFFFATELRPAIEDEEDILEDLENNPIPYMMLLCGANYPLTFHKKDQVVQVISEFDLDKINTAELRESFITEYNDGVYRFALKGWSEYPHYSCAYYDEHAGIIVLSAMTDRGYDKLVATVNGFGYGLPDEPLIRVNMSMSVTAKEILGKDVVLNNYDKLFHVDTPEEKSEEVEKLNAFVKLVLPDINAGREPDIENMAKKAGLDVETARDVLKHVMGKLDDMEKDME
jgi:hypothetical protein